MSRNSLKNVARLIDIANNNSPVEERFLSDLKRSIEITDQKESRPGSRTFKPSGMGCKRASYYVLTGAKWDDRPKTYNSVSICNAGTDAHVRLQTAIMKMKKNGIDVEWVDVEKFVKTRELNDLEIKSHTKTETKLYNKRYNMSFMCDGIIKYNNKYYIIEIKTEMSTKWYDRSDVAPEHNMQAKAYSLNFGIDDVLFIYMSRDNCELKCFKYSVTDEMRQSVVDYVKDVTKYVELKLAPPKEVSKKGCNYCGFKDQCRKDG